MAFIASKPLFRIGVAALATLCSAISAFAGNTYSLSLNKTEIVRLPASAGAVVIGNPAIADVTVHSADTLFVVGRGYGETNLIVLNATGQTIMNANIQVTNKLSPQGVRLYNGSSRESYNCAPYCMPAPILGDDPAFIGSNSGQSQASNATTAAPATQATSSSTQPVSFGSGTSGASEQDSFESGNDF